MHGYSYNHGLMLQIPYLDAMTAIVLKFGQRNSRVLQAYAIMESKRPEVNAREVIGLFGRARKVNPRDAGVLQPYALFAAKLGDIDASRDLLREANKRHSPVWQA